MDKELNALAHKIQLVTELCQRLRRENQSLRQDLASAQQEIRQLHSRLETARARLDAVIDKIPS